MALTAKQQRFVDEYLIDLNATQAALRAGYSEKTSYSIGQENLNKPEIAQIIQKAMDARSERTEITADYVLAGIQEIAERCLQRSPVMEGYGKERTQATDGEGRHVWAFDATGANKAFENLGKHLKLFTDKVEHSGKIALEQLTDEELAAKIAAYSEGG
ncbi:terminase small subunit [Allopontixanthobacter sediminis]|uniref:Terminase small subunit n=1 Tax=Allopontixanthobacter sediminis TaxID=1689985 RepID=A0A845AXJ4_9SPHN|nr:terminase small subunit [Allopontixanthobacter sediminis]MXP42970.1 terminase small subunit [Allopontixanthobacter sediminis]